MPPLPAVGSQDVLTQVERLTGLRAESEWLLMASHRAIARSDALCAKGARLRRKAACQQHQLLRQFEAATAPPSSGSDARAHE
jgi:hypothetical protein